MSIGSQMPYQRRSGPAASGTGSLVLDKHRQHTVEGQRETQAAHEELRQQTAPARKELRKEAKKHMG